MNNKLVSRQEVLIDTFSRITDYQLMAKFLEDVMTENEVNDIAARLRAAFMLQAGYKYNEICEQTGLSSRTIARISQCLKNDGGGYSAAIDIIKQHHPHI